MGVSIVKPTTARMESTKIPERSESCKNDDCWVGGWHEEIGHESLLNCTNGEQQSGSVPHGLTVNEN
jgi:hypothetical protein